MDVDALAQVVWDYHHVGHRVEPAEVILVLGSHDTRVAERGAELFLQGQAPLILFTGNLGALTSDIWTRPEAEIFAEVAERMGVPRDRMLLESRATNTAENVELSRALLQERGLLPRRAIAVQKPYMERRTLATFQQRWPELEVMVTSPQTTIDEYTRGEITKEQVIHIMVGDLHRLIVYGQRGWSAPQEVPEPVLDAFRRLVGAGYGTRLVPGAPV